MAQCANPRCPRGEEFEPTQPQHIYCCERCANAVRARRKRARQSGRTDVLDTLPEPTKEQPPITPKLLTQKKCGRYSCQEYFVPKNVNHEYHSEYCRVEASKEQKLLESLENLEDLDPLDVAARKNQIVLELERQIGVLQRALLKEESRTEVILHKAEEYWNDIPAPRFNRHAWIQKHTGKGRPTTAGYMFSDTQAGKWENDIGLQVLLDDYLPAMAQKIIACADVQRQEGAVDKLITALLGDLLENCIIFPGQRQHLDRYKNGDSSVDQVLIMVDAIGAFFETLRPHFKELAVTSAWGNHGRTSKKEDPNLNKDNYDRLIFELLKRTVTNLDIEFIEPIEDRFVFSAEGYLFGGVHGHQFGYKNSLNAMETTVLRWDAIQHFDGAPLDYLLVAHKHHPASLQVQGIEIFQNGALDGGSMYLTERTGIWSPPSQELFFVSEAYGVDSRHRLLPSPRKPRAQEILTNVTRWTS